MKGSHQFPALVVSFDTAACMKITRSTALGQTTNQYLSRNAVEFTRDHLKATRPQQIQFIFTFE